MIRPEDRGYAQRMTKGLGGMGGGGMDELLGDESPRSPQDDLIEQMLREYDADEARAAGTENVRPGSTSSNEGLPEDDTSPDALMEKDIRPTSKVGSRISSDLDKLLAGGDVTEQPVAQPRAKMPVNKASAKPAVSKPGPVKVEPTKVMPAIEESNAGKPEDDTLNRKGLGDYLMTNAYGNRAESPAKAMQETGSWAMGGPVMEGAVGLGKAGLRRLLGRAKPATETAIEAAGQLAGREAPLAIGGRPAPKMLGTGGRDFGRFPQTKGLPPITEEMRAVSNTRPIMQGAGPGQARASGTGGRDFGRFPKTEGVPPITDRMRGVTSAPKPSVEARMAAEKAARTGKLNLKDTADSTKTQYVPKNDGVFKGTENRAPAARGDKKPASKARSKVKSKE